MNIDNKAVFFKMVDLKRNKMLFLLRVFNLQMMQLLYVSPLREES